MGFCKGNIGMLHAYCSGPGTSSSSYNGSAHRINSSCSASGTYNCP
jgi:hypothetical protein